MLTWQIREWNILYFHISINIRQMNCMFRFRYLRFFINQCKYSLRTCNRILKFCHNSGNLIKWLCVLICIAQETGQLSYAHCTAYNCKCSGNSNSCVNQTVNKSCRRVRDGWEKCCPQGCLLQSFIHFVETLCCIFSAPKCLNHFLVSDHFINQSCLLSTYFRLQAEHTKCSLCNKICYKEWYRCDKNHNKCNRYIYG